VLDAELDDPEELDEEDSDELEPPEEPDDSEEPELPDPESEDPDELLVSEPEEPPRLSVR